MTCEELREDYALFAMGGLEAPEREEIRAHLARGCAACSAGVRDARGWTPAMAAGSAGPQPSRRLRKRILASVGAAERVWPWKLAFASAVALAIVAAAGLLYTSQRRGADRAAMREAIGFLESPETRTVSFGQGAPAPPRGRVLVNPQSGVLLIASHLPPPPAGRTYEMWIVPKTGNPAPAGLFSSAASGAAYHVYRARVSLPATAAIAVTLEAAGGAAAPTTQPIIVAPL